MGKKSTRAVPRERIDYTQLLVSFRREVRRRTALSLHRYQRRIIKRSPASASG